jgi:hypothetical protein
MRTIIGNVCGENTVRAAAARNEKRLVCVAA